MLLQKKHLGFTYTDITVEMLRLWEIPEKIILPIQHYYQAQTIEINKDVKVLNIATRLALIDSHPDKFSLDALMESELCANLSITIDDVTNAAEFACEEAENILNIMNAKFY